MEVYAEPDFTKEIVGGSLGGLALLALLTAGLYKVRHVLRILYSLIEAFYMIIITIFTDAVWFFY